VILVKFHVHLIGQKKISFKIKQKMNKKHYLVTGGLGFIGTNLVKRLQKNYKITIIDNSCSHNIKYLSFNKNVRIFKKNITKNSFSLKKYGKIDAVIHLAAYGSVVDSVSNPKLNFKNNVISTLNILEECKKNNINKIIFSSTGGALMGDTPPPINEKTLPNPISPYGASKLACEGYCSAYSSSYGINVIILRFSNIIGPYSWHKKGVVTKFIKSILSDKKLSIYGPLNSSRDYLFIDDLCYGIEKALKSKITGCEKIHISSGKEITIEKLYKELIKISKAKNIKILRKSKRTGEVINNFSKNYKAKKILKFKVKNNLNTSLRKTWKWFQKNKKNNVKNK